VCGNFTSSTAYSISIYKLNVSTLEVKITFISACIWFNRNSENVIKVVNCWQGTSPRDGLEDMGRHIQPTFARGLSCDWCTCKYGEFQGQAMVRHETCRFPTFIPKGPSVDLLEWPTIFPSPYSARSGVGDPSACCLPHFLYLARPLLSSSSYSSSSSSVYLSRNKTVYSNIRLQTVGKLPEKDIAHWTGSIYQTNTFINNYRSGKTRKCSGI